MFPGAPLVLSSEIVEHGDVCPLDAPPSALTACETDPHGDVSIFPSTFFTVSLAMWYCSLPFQ